MSPLELSGKPFLGHFTDRRNSYCYHCGRGFRSFRFDPEMLDQGQQDIELYCPYCKRHFDTVPISELLIE